MKKLTKQQLKEKLDEIRGEINPVELKRTFTIERAEGDNPVVDMESRTMRATLSSEYPVLRSFGYEVLSHNPEHISFPDTIPFQVDHDNSALKNIGTIKYNGLREDKKTDITPHFGEGPDEDRLLAKYRDKHLTDLSVGYAYEELLNIIDGKDEEPDTYIFAWRALEGSAVTFGADPTIGAGRSAAEDLAKEENKKTNTEVRKMKCKKCNAELSDGAIFCMDCGERQVAETPKKRHDSEVDISIVVSKEVDKIASEMRGIIALGERKGFQKDAAKFIEDGKSLSEFKDFILDSQDERNSKASIPTGLRQEGFLDMEAKQIEEYNIVRAIDDMAQKGKLRDGIEKDAHETLLKLSKKEIGADRFMAPYDMHLRRADLSPSAERALINKHAARGLNVAIGSQGGYTTQTSVQNDFIELQRNNQVTAEAGITELTGLVDRIEFSGQSSAATAYYLLEDGEVTLSQQGFLQKVMSGRTLSAATDISRKMLISSRLSPSVTNFVQGDLAIVLAQRKDLDILSGSGAGQVPLGLANTSGINSITINAVPTNANMIDFETQLEVSNFNSKNLKWILSPEMKGVLKNTLKASGVAGYIMNDAGEVNGYGSLITNQVRKTLGGTSDEHEMFFGDWRQCITGEWGFQEIQVSKEAKLLDGGVRVVIHVDWDVMFRQPTAFSYAADGRIA